MKELQVTKFAITKHLGNRRGELEYRLSGGAGEGEGEEGGRAGQGERLQCSHSSGREEDRPERGAQQEALEGRKGRARSSLCPSMSFYQEQRGKMNLSMLIMFD